MDRKIVVFLAVILLCLSVSVSVSAGPTIIRDKRLADLALTPTLGRGYTIVTNTYQSKCLDQVILTDPSYDFTYTFRSIDTSDSSSTRTIMEYNLDMPLETGGVGVSGPGSDQTGDTRIEHKHHVFVRINMDTYYASVDEARTNLSASASQLLMNNDLPGFFSSCGSYYVRSLGRNAKFISIFSYSDFSETKDAKFESDLKASIMKFGGGAGGHLNDSVLKIAGQKKLTIIARAYGLGKNEGATLISYDIETFKAAVKDAFISMQNPMTGKVTTMEIVPWVENTDFQSMIQLEKAIVDPRTGKTMSLYKKKQVLNENAEFLAEIEKHDRNLMNIYYKSTICKQMVQANWMEGGKIHSDFKDAEIANNKFPKERILLSKLVSDFLSKEKINALLKKEENFMYGSNGADVCIGKMLSSGMFTVSFRHIDECKKIRGELSTAMNETIDNYCMPEIAKKLPASIKKNSGTSK